MRPTALGVAVALAVVTAAVLPAHANTQRYAVVLGNNQPESDDQPVLRYADDDAVATYELLREAGVTARLLVRMDDDTRRLHPSIRADGPPTWQALGATLDELHGLIDAANARGHRTELLLFYSGHGDVEHGEGFIVLEDARLTRTRLHAEVLDRSRATRNHVIVDACKSYFLAFEKGPGGTRTHYRGSFASPAPRSHPRTGFVLSTSSARDSHEWERYQAGVFSYQVRSALRGAADVDRDGSISYAELGAFLTAANSAVINPRYRPDFAVKPPGALAEPLLSWPARSEIVAIDAPLGHAYLETATGVRVLDLHPAAGEPVDLRVPASRPLFLRSGDDQREVVIAAAGSARLSELSSEPLPITRKGALHRAFEDLFRVPFAGHLVTAYVARVEREAAASATRSHEVRAPREPSALRPTAGWLALGGAALGASFNLIALQRQSAGDGASHRRRVELNGQIETLNRLAIGAYAVAGLAALVWVAADFGDDTSPLPVVLVPHAGGLSLSLEASW